MSTTMWIVLVAGFAIIIGTTGLLFFGAALERNRGRTEQAEELKELLRDVGPRRS